jgi:hypothetical protein
MERSNRCTEREEAKIPAASFIGDVRAHLIELQVSDNIALYSVGCLS